MCGQKISTILKLVLIGVIFLEKADPTTSLPINGHPTNYSETVEKMGLKGGPTLTMVVRQSEGGEDGEDENENGKDNEDPPEATEPPPPPPPPQMAVGSTGTPPPLVIYVQAPPKAQNQQLSQFQQPSQGPMPGQGQVQGGAAPQNLSPIGAQGAQQIIVVQPSSQNVAKPMKNQFNMGIEEVLKAVGAVDLESFFANAQKVPMQIGDFWNGAFGWETGGDGKKI